MRYAPLVLLVIVLTLTIYSCSSDNRQDDIPQVNNNPPNNNDSDFCKSKNMKWSKEIDSIMKVRCVACHGGATPAGSVKLDTYNGVKANINKILPAIKHDPSLSSAKWMPKDEPRMDSCTIVKIEEWFKQGMIQ